MGHLRWAVSWLLVLAVGLAPILLYWAGGIIRRFLVRRKWRSRPRLEDERLGKAKASERK